jgi:uncharacterized protein (DUF342 family)
MTSAAVAIHFRSQTITTTVDGVACELVTAELVKKNQSLISQQSDHSLPSITLQPGKYTFLAEDGKSLIAEISGYPVLSQTSKDNTSVYRVDITPIIEISADQMLASLTLFPALPDSALPEFADILAFCKERDISSGIDEPTIRETIVQVRQLQQPQEHIPIARGLLPLAGKDAYLRFEVEIGPLPGKILQDGSIDWRERKMFIGIDKDELIATKVPLTEGTPGRDIHGLPLPQKPGKDIKVKVSGDVQYIEESRQVLATSAGALSIVNETDVKVSAKQTIDGDVDFSVGNIESNDALEVKGNVNPGFTVICKGDLLVGGNINGATVTNKGNTKIVSGLIGENARLITEGDVDVSFIERGTIAGGGAVVIGKGAYYANISAAKKLLCRPDSKVVGGSLICGEDFIGDSVGSGNATPAIIAAGIEPSRIELLQRLRDEAANLKNELANLLNMNGKEYEESPVYKAKETILLKRQNNLKKFNLIKDSPLYSKFDPGFNYTEAFIAIRGRIFSGTKLRIGNISTTLEEDAAAIRFHVDRSTGHIVATPYTERKSTCS